MLVRVFGQPSLGCYRLQSKHRTAAISCQSNLQRQQFEPHSLSIKCLCHLKVRHVAAGRPRHSSCPWVAMSGPPRTGVGGYQGFGRTGGGGDCRQIEMTGDSWGTPELRGAGWVLERSRRGCVAPSCRTPPPRRRGGRQEVRPPSGPAGLKGDGCRDRESGEPSDLFLNTFSIFQRIP